MIYLDHAASTPLFPEALKVLSEASEKAFANPAAQHRLGRNLADKIEKVRELFLSELEADGYELVFTSSATEANNLLLSSLNYEDAYCSPGDHPSLSRVVDAHYQTKNFQRVDGQPDLSFFSDSPSLAVFTSVNNFSGSTLDLSSLPQTDCHLHIDASQSFGKERISLKSSAIDSLTIAAHKMGGPKGIAALIFKRDIELKPTLLGGGHEKGLRSSTPAAPLIFSWAAALQKAASIRDEKKKLIGQLNEKIRTQLKADFPFPAEKCSPYILVAITPEIPSDVLLRHLEEMDIIVSTSSACSSKIKAFDPAYADLGVEEKWHKNILRISMGSSTSEDEVQFFIEKFNSLVESLK